ncbi:hypothetical protein SEEH1831_25341 [Salmonella enterica subsp. enterica serovar Heidelberg str. 77-1831]|nr:hypothetical protein SEEH1831_25341 [Salmonella enterica subsp. enterica serovar Heidelberg str. 77-1831]
MVVLDKGVSEIKNFLRIALFHLLLITTTVDAAAPDEIAIQFCSDICRIPALTIPINEHFLSYE